MVALAAKENRNFNNMVETILLREMKEYNLKASEGEAVPDKSEAKEVFKQNSCTYPMCSCRENTFTECERALKISG